MRNYGYEILLCTICYMSMLFFSLPTYLLWLKYAAFAEMLFYIARFICVRFKLHTKNNHSLLQLFGYIVMIAYLFVCIDTFVFHAWFPLPGLYRYAVFDFYLFSAPLFLLSGVCTELKNASADNQRTGFEH